MQFDLESACKITRTNIMVPVAPMAAIRNGARVPAQQRKHGKRWVFAFALAGITCAGAAAVEMTHVSFTQKGGIVLDGHPIASKSDPTESDVRAMASGMSFDLVLPSGLPEGTRLSDALSYAPDAIALEYDLPGDSRRSNHALWVLLARVRGALHDVKTSEFMRMPHGRIGEFWKVGNEQVYLDAPSTMTEAEISAMKIAMGARDAR